MKCERCHSEGKMSVLKLRLIELPTGHAYLACIDCRSHLKGKFKPVKMERAKIVEKRSPLKRDELDELEITDCELEI